MKRVFALSGLCLILSLPALGQTDEEIAARFERRVHTFGTTTLPYRLFVPDTYRADVAYPVVLALHGAGERGSDNDIHIQKHALATAWAHPANQSDHASFVVAPQLPAGGAWTNLAYDPVAGFVFLDPVRREMATVMDLLKALEAEFSIDPDRIYVTGLSMGGIGVWDFIRRFPTRFAAAIPMSGVGEATSAFRISQIPVWAFHGKDDDVVTVEGSRSMISALTGLGHRPVFTDCNLQRQCSPLTFCTVKGEILSQMPVLYTEYEDRGHNIWRESYENPNLIEWTFLQNRRSHRTPVDRFRVTFEVDVTLARTTFPPGAGIGLVGDSWPLEQGRVTVGCPEIGDDIVSVRVAFPKGETPPQLQYRFAFTSGGILNAEGMEEVARVLEVRQEDERLPIVFWDDAGARPPDVPVDPIPASGSAALASTPLSWSAGTIAGRWDVQLALDDSFGQILIEKTGLADRTLYVAGLDSLTVYHWRVRGVNGSGAGLWSGPWSFFTMGIRPLLTSPPNGSRQPREVQLEWKPYPGTTLYTVYVSSDAEFRSFSAHRASGTSTLVGPLDDLTTYFWKVRSNTGLGSTKWSETWSFSVEAALSADGEVSSSPVRFAITGLYPHPAAGIVTVNYELPERGVVALRVYDVLGREAAVVSEGPREPGRYAARWDSRLLVPGAYLVVLTANGTTQAGRMMLVVD